MNSYTIEKQFARMGARFQIVRQENLQRRPSLSYAIDLVTDRDGQIFELRLDPEQITSLEISVLQCAHRDRHLLLLVKSPEAKDRFLCGHDEREWFVAAVPGGASCVAQAKLALQPEGVRLAGDGAGLNVRQRTRRHNRAFIRQGEWFFVPAPGLQVDTKLILRNEPIRRGSGKPHFVAELFRSGGEAVKVSKQHPNGLTDTEFHALLSRQPEAKFWKWVTMQRNAGVYARGTVRHRDHATITLHDWHQILMNTENTTRTMANVSFLD